MTTILLIIIVLVLGVLIFGKLLGTVAEGLGLLIGILLFAVKIVYETVMIAWRLGRNLFGRYNIGGGGRGLLPNVSQSEPSPAVSAQSREDYSEYRREGYIIRDYRVGRDRSSEGEENR